jgi:hypothetical protein
LIYVILYRTFTASTAITTSAFDVVVFLSALDEEM